MKRNAGGKFSKENIDELVVMVKSQTDVMDIYEYLDHKFCDNRTKWNYLKEALKQAHLEINH